MKALDAALGAAAGFLLARAACVLWLVAGIGARGVLLVAGRPLAAAAALGAAALLRRRRAGLWGLAAAAAWLSLWPSGARTRVNRLGLVSEAKSRAITRDFSNDPRKDHYPVCTFRYNSLGFRDEEPKAAAGRRRVLLVGDSFVWGDGIADNEKTLGYLLRAELERRAPGRYDVMSAAYPGLGLYGYSRFLNALAPELHPDVVVVGYLGESDHDPLDSQAIADRLPSPLPMRNVAINSGAAQYAHEASNSQAASLWREPANERRFEALLDEDARRARESGYRLLFIQYFGARPLPAPIEALALPETLRYPGSANEYWYGRDIHPKPELNRRLAVPLAERIVRTEA